MRRIKLIVALAAAMVVLMMAAAPAMANIDIDHGDNFRFGHSDDNLIVFSFTNSSGLLDNGVFDNGDFSIDLAALTSASADRALGSLPE